VFGKLRRFGTWIGLVNEPEPADITTLRKDFDQLAETIKAHPLPDKKFLGRKKYTDGINAYVIKLNDILARALQLTKKYPHGTHYYQLKLIYLKTHEAIGFTYAKYLQNYSESLQSLKRAELFGLYLQAVYLLTIPEIYNPTRAIRLLQEIIAPNSKDVSLCQHGESAQCNTCEDARALLGLCYAWGFAGDEKIEEGRGLILAGINKNISNAYIYQALRIRNNIGHGRPLTEPADQKSEKNSFDHLKHIEGLLARKRKTNSYVFYLLGICYRDGLGVAADSQIADVYFSKAKSHQPNNIPPFCDDPAASDKTKIPPTVGLSCFDSEEKSAFPAETVAPLPQTKTKVAKTASKASPIKTDELVQEIKQPSADDISAAIAIARLPQETAKTVTPERPGAKRKNAARLSTKNNSAFTFTKSSFNFAISAGATIIVVTGAITKTAVIDIPRAGLNLLVRGCSKLIASCCKTKSIIGQAKLPTKKTASRVILSPAKKTIEEPGIDSTPTAVATFDETAISATLENSIPGKKVKKAKSTATSASTSAESPSEAKAHATSSNVVSAVSHQGKGVSVPAAAKSSSAKLSSKLGRPAAGSSKRKAETKHSLPLQASASLQSDASKPLVAAPDLALQTPATVLLAPKKEPVTAQNQPKKSTAIFAQAKNPATPFGTKAWSHIAGGSQPTHLAATAVSPATDLSATNSAASSPVATALATSDSAVDLNLAARSLASVSKPIQQQSPQPEQKTSKALDIGGTADEIKEIQKAARELKAATEEKQKKYTNYTPKKYTFKQLKDEYKIDLSTSFDKFLKNVLPVYDKLASDNHQVRIRGSSVVMLLLGLDVRCTDILKGVTDIDLKTSASFEQVKTMFGPKDKDAKDNDGVTFTEGTIRLCTLKPTNPLLPHIDITQFHRYETSGKNAGRLVDSKDEDAIDTYDITLNTLYFSRNSSGEWELFDPTGLGLQDLLARKIRLVGNPNVNLQRDPVCLVRAICAKNKYPEFAMEEDTQQAIQQGYAHFGKYDDSNKYLHLFKLLLKILKLPLAQRKICLDEIQAVTSGNSKSKNLLTLIYQLLEAGFGKNISALKNLSRDPSECDNSRHPLLTHAIKKNDLISAFLYRYAGASPADRDSGPRRTEVHEYAGSRRWPYFKLFQDLISAITPAMDETAALAYLLKLLEEEKRLLAEPTSETAYRFPTSGIYVRYGYSLQNVDAGAGAAGAGASQTLPRQLFG